MSAPTSGGPVPAPSTAEKANKAEIFKGTGKFVARPRPAARVTEEGDITLNFADTNIREVVRVILGDILKRNYVIDPNVQGTVTIQTSRPLAKEALLPTLETLLQLNGAALVEADGIDKIVPLADAPKEAHLPGVAGEHLSRVRGYGVQVVPLQHVSVNEMVKVLTPMTAESNILYADTARNLLMLGGTRDELVSLLDTIAIFDVDWLAGMSFGYFPLEEAEAQAVVDELQEILLKGENAPLSDLLRFVPIDRLNAVIAISPKSEYIEKAGVWIRRLDRSGDTETPRLFVYYVQNQRATDLADTLSRIFTGSATTRREETDRLRPGLQPTTLRSSTTSEGTSGESPRTGLTQTASAAPTATSSLTSRRPTGIAARNERGARAGATSATLQIGSGQEVRVIADETNNALVILATPADYRMLEATLKKLDIVPLQVLIEATIAEVRLRDELKYGLQWFFEHNDSTAVLSDTALPAPTFPGFSYVFSTNSVKVVLDALDSITDVNVISSPQLFVLDNQAATLQVGDQVPIATQSAVNVNDAALTPTTTTVVNQIQQRDTGVILTVVPRVNAGGLVVLDIQQEISDVVATESSGIDSPTIRQRRIETTVAVQSGETVALGGLIRETRERGKSGIPILHELPLIGSLFGSSSDIKDRTELLVVITPRVVRNVSEARQITNDLRLRLRSVSPLDRKIR